MYMCEGVCGMQRVYMCVVCACVSVVCTFLDLCLYKGERFTKEGILDIKTRINPTNTQQYVHASSAHSPGTGPGIIEGKLLRYLRTNLNETTFQIHNHIYTALANVQPQETAR